MRLKSNTYSPQNAAQVFKDVSCPTPTDEKHGADWWNENFGRKIIYEFENKMKQFAKEIEERRPNKSVVLLSFSSLYFPGLTNKDHTTDWWETDFANLIRQAMKDQIMELFESIKKMREVA